MRSSCSVDGDGVEVGVGVGLGEFMTGALVSVPEKFVAEVVSPSSTVDVTPC
jgi:hypothetical protein